MDINLILSVDPELNLISVSVLSWIPKHLTYKTLKGVLTCKSRTKEAWYPNHLKNSGTRQVFILSM